jgi:hypothetical protein
MTPRAPSICPTALIISQFMAVILAPTQQIPMPNVQRPIKETGAIYEYEQQRLWPLNLKERKAKIAQFAKEHE